MSQVVVVGGGLVGLATAWSLVQRGIRVSLVEKEGHWAEHQSGHNSGVVDSGAFAQPGSLSAQLIIGGAAALERFCTEYGVAFRRTGQLIVATTAEELHRLIELGLRARRNGVSAEQLTPAELAEKEPHVRGLGALWLEETAVCDYRGVAEALAKTLAAAGAELMLGTRALQVYERAGRAHVLVQGERTRVVTGQQAVVCAGLNADQLYPRRRTDLQIVPLRGRFAQLAPTRVELVRGLVFPVPDPGLPFPGVHLARGLDGRVQVGPAALPAFSREGYRWRDVRLHDVRGTLGFSGTWRLAAHNLKSGTGELAQALIKPAFVRAVRRLVPEVRAHDLAGSFTGVHAQAVRRDGTLVDGFEARRVGSVLHVLNTPAAGATASLAIGEHIASRL